MGKKIFVGNLSFSTTSAELESLFAQVGTCESATVVTDRDTGRSRGFGFVEMSSASEAGRAITVAGRSTSARRATRSGGAAGEDAADTRAAAATERTGNGCAPRGAQPFTHRDLTAAVRGRSLLIGCLSGPGPMGAASEAAPPPRGHGLRVVGA